jgi:Flp pilus assembly pilin Flp
MLLTYLRVRAAALCDDSGQTQIEYALLAFIVSIAVIILLSTLGLDLSEMFDAVEDELGLADKNAPATGGVSDAATATGVE